MSSYIGYLGMLKILLMHQDSRRFQRILQKLTTVVSGSGLVSGVVSIVVSSVVSGVVSDAASGRIEDDHPCTQN